MSDTFTVGTKDPKSVTAEPARQLVVYNAGGGTLYYKATSDVSSSSNDGNVASGASTTFTNGTKWLIAGTVGAKVFITYSQGSGTDLATQAELNEEATTREAKDAERVVGPASATDLRVAIFDGTTGKKVKDGGTLLSALAPKTEVTTEKERAETAEGTKVAKASSLAATTTDVLTSKITTDTTQRFTLNTDGKMEFGKGEEAAADTTLERSGVKALKVGQTLQVGEELEVDGDINHDGSKVGFFGIAPESRPEVKKAALTGDELALALQKLGIVKVEA